MNVLSGTLISSALVVSFLNPAMATMNQDQMEAYVSSKVTVVEHEKGFLQFNYNNVQMALVSDKAHDRMRIIAPIIKVEEMSPQEIYITMEANYHMALDARYATSNGILYSTYIHPLSPLTEAQLDSALRQVSTLALTYGDQYTSGELDFGGSYQGQKSENESEGL